MEGYWFVGGLGMRALPNAPTGTNGYRRVLGCGPGNWYVEMKRPNLGVFLLYGLEKAFPFHHTSGLDSRYSARLTKTRIYNFHFDYSIIRDRD